MATTFLHLRQSVVKLHLHFRTMKLTSVIEDDPETSPSNKWWFARL
jgi:hypothetical protein